MLVLIPILLLPPLVALLAARSTWGRRSLSYVCIGLATALPLWMGGCAKHTDQARAHNRAEKDADPQLDQEPHASDQVRLEQDGPDAGTDTAIPAPPRVAPVKDRVPTPPTIHDAISEPIQVAGDLTEKQISDPLASIRPTGSGRSP